MKKFSKIMLMIVLILVIFGGVLLGAGVASGASLFDISHDAHYSSHVRSWIYNWAARMDDWDDDEDDFSDRIDDSVDQWADDLEDSIEERIDQSLGTGHDTDHHTSRQSVLADQVEKLEVEVFAGTVEIRETTGSEIKLSGLYDADEVEFDREDRELKIARNYHHDHTGENLVIEIPGDKKFQELDIYIGAGSLEASRTLQVQETDIEVDAGSVEIQLLDSQKTDLECNAGKLSVKHTGRLDDYKVELECNTGKIQLGGNSYAGVQNGTFGSTSSKKTIDIECNAGNTEVTFEE